MIPGGSASNTRACPRITGLGTPCTQRYRVVNRANGPFHYASAEIGRRSALKDDVAGPGFGPSRYGAELMEFSSGTAFRPGQESQLDEADLRIIDMVVRDGRMNARSMVEAVKLTEETVAARIRNLIERDIIGITSIFDWNAAGYHWDVWLAIECEAGQSRRQWRSSRDWTRSSRSGRCSVRLTW